MLAVALATAAATVLHCGPPVRIAIVAFGTLLTSLLLFGADLVASVWGWAQIAVAVAFIVSLHCAYVPELSPFRVRRRLSAEDWRQIERLLREHNTERDEE